MKATPDAPSEEPRLSSTLLTTMELPTGVLSAALQPDQDTLYVAGMDGQIRSINLDTEQETVVGQHESFASGVVLSNEAQVVISSGYDGLLIWHDIQTRRPIHVVEAHRFWSWRLAISPDGHYVASSTGQYRSGGLKYEPAPESEPSIKVFNATNGNLTHSFTHVPPVTSIAFSPDSTKVAAANLMGNIYIYDLNTGEQVKEWTSEAFTSWGIIKSHHYIGGVFDLSFSPSGDQLYACGMGPMRDPMAGNGKQTWQRFDWTKPDSPLSGEIESKDAGKGLMESLAMDPTNKRLVMAGRLAQGQWNTAIFDTNTGSLIHSLDTKMRTTKALIDPANKRLILCGAVSQKGPKNGEWPAFGRVHVYQLDAV